MSWRGNLPAACWDAHEASAIIPVEAESTSDGVFLATHSTIPITQRDQVDTARGGAVVDEQALLRAVQDQPADQPIIPILGKSGTGKSHLVRWLRAHSGNQGIDPPDLRAQAPHVLARDPRTDS